MATNGGPSANTMTPAGMATDDSRSNAGGTKFQTGVWGAGQLSSALSSTPVGWTTAGTNALTGLVVVDALTS